MRTSFKAVAMMDMMMCMQMCMCMFVRSHKSGSTSVMS